MRGWFSSSPGEVGFTSDGRNLVVTTKSNNTVEVFPMKRNGLPAVAEAVINKSAGGVPFAVSFGRTGKRILFAEAEKSTVTTYKVKRSGKLKVLQEPLANGQETLCWLERAGNYVYGGNTGNYRHRLPHGQARQAVLDQRRGHRHAALGQLSGQ